MTIHTASNFDIEKFRKVASLVNGGATDGERAAAKARATKIASNAGLSFDQAMSKLDDKQPQPVNFFSGFDDWMETKEPGYKAKKSQESDERERKYEAQRSEILREFGTVKAFFEPNEHEKILLSAGAPFVTKRSSYVDVCGTRRMCAKEFAGISSHFFKLEDVDPEAVTAIKSAFPFPETIYDAFAELKEWDKLNSNRALFDHYHEYYHDLPIELRVELLRDVMRNKPVASWEDLDARFHYKSYSWQQQWIDERDFEDEEWGRLYADIQILRSAAEASKSEAVQNRHRTNADKKAAVLSMLETNPDLSDREIARRTGVSPQTVNNWRNRTVKNGQSNHTGQE